MADIDTPEGVEATVLNPPTLGPGWRRGQAPTDAPLPTAEEAFGPETTPSTPPLAPVPSPSAAALPTAEDAFGPAPTVAATTSTTTTPTTPPSLSDLERHRVVAPIIHGLRSAAAALEGGAVSVPGYGAVPAATPEETLGESVSRAPVRAAAAALRGIPPLINAPGETFAGAPVERLTGSETAGDVAAAVANLLAPWLGAKALGVGGATAETIEAAKGVQPAEKAGAIAQEAVPRAYKAAKAVADSHYENAAALAEEAGARVLPEHITEVQKSAQDFLAKAGDSLTGRARELVENIASHPGDVSYEEWNQLSHELGDMALTPEQHAVSDDFVKKGLRNLYTGTRSALKESVVGTEAGDELETANEQWTKVSDLRKLTKGVAPSKTGTQALRALGDPAYERAALDTMTPAEQDAYGTLKRAASIQKLGAKKVPYVLAFEGGRLLFNPPKEGYDTAALELAGTALVGAALQNPKLAILLAQGLRTPAAAGAATTIANRLAKYAGRLSVGEAPTAYEAIVE